MPSNSVCRSLAKSDHKIDTAETPEWLDILRRRSRDLRLLAGATFRQNTPDRVVLENCILPYFADLPTINRVLWIGCDHYTKWYASIFHRQSEYWTLDRRPARIRYGASERRHVVDGLHNLSTHFSEGSLDLILCNGVFDRALVDPIDIEKAFDACRSALAPGGWLMIGCNDEPAHVPVPLSEITSLRDGFRPRIFPPFARDSYTVPGHASGHNFSFYGPVPRGSPPAVNALP